MINEINDFFYQHGYILFIFLVVLVVAIIKIRYPFWNIQPVYHTYDIWRWVYWNPFVFYRHAPVKTKFYDPFHIKTKIYSDITEKELSEWVDLIQSHYLPTDRIFCTMTKPHLDAHMTGFNEPAFVSFYKEVVEGIPEEYQLNLAAIKEPIGCIVSRPTRIFIKGLILDEPLTAYYWDFVCVHRKYTEKHLSRFLIQTNEFNQRKQNPAIQISFFKKEVLLCQGVVPLTQFKTRTYYLKLVKPPVLPSEYECVRVYKEHTQLLYDSLEKGGDFDFAVIPDFGHLLALIRAKVLFVFLLKSKNAVCGIYFFKDLCFHYEDLDDDRKSDDLGNSIHCIASIQHVESSIFYMGFAYSLYSILKYNPKYNLLLMDDIADNSVLLGFWKKTPIFETDTAYYFFNYFYPRQFSSDKCLVLM